MNAQCLSSLSFNPPRPLIRAMFAYDLSYHFAFACSTYLLTAVLLQLPLLGPFNVFALPQLPVL